ncbi:MAG TPA: response regulator, partial [Candidatus Glassbacteria bacterium]|nr:response regulator [Candidatus Glassbacteria bacterium]
LDVAEFNLERVGYQVEVTADPGVGLNRAIEHDFDLILLDLTMPGLNGEEVLSLLKPFSLQHRVVVIGSHSRDEHRTRARDLGAIGYIQKPIHPDDLCRAVGDFLAQRTAGERAGPESAACRHPVDRLALWIFDSGEVTRARRLASLCVAGGLLGVLIWLILK